MVLRVEGDAGRQPSARADAGGANSERSWSWRTSSTDAAVSKIAKTTLAPRAAEPHPGAYELTRRPCGNERVVSLEVHSFGGGSTRTWPALSAEASSKPPRLRERVLRLSGHRVMVLDHADTSWPSGAAQRGRGEPKSITTRSDCAGKVRVPP